MINAKRLALLTDEEQNIYFSAKMKRVKNSRVEELKSKYTLLGDGERQHVLCENIRPKEQPQASYRGTKYALAGILLEGETLEDFIFHRIYMSEVIERRAEQWISTYAREWMREKRGNE